MLKERNINIKRIENFYARTESKILSENILLDLEFTKITDTISFKDATKLKFKKITENEFWGKKWEKAWFRMKGKIPASWKGKCVVANLDFSGEGLVFDKSGMPLQGTTNNSVMCPQFKRDIVKLFDSCKGGESVELWADVSCNGIVGIVLKPDPEYNDPEKYGNYQSSVSKCRLAVFDKDLWLFRLDVEILLDIVKKLHEYTPRSRRIMRCLSDALNFVGDDYSKCGKARKILSEVMDKKASASALEVYAVGHAHIDTGWLWPVKESIRKCGRTFANQLKLIEEYPGYIFGASQAQHYAFTKEYYPEIYAKIKKCVKQGSWELQGGMWVEADCNIISGESMVRQIIHGKNFFMDEFGVDVKNLWLPDVFGYSAAMPQILKKSGIDLFLTQKISWSQFNEFPHNTFKWRGIDGSEVITHFPPENNYNSSLKPTSLINAEERFKENDFINEFVSLFGIGDGGGGPTEDHIEHGIRLADLEGCPKVKFSKAQDCFEKLIEYGDKLKIWSGELYLEYHRGTYTTQAKVKKENRLFENKLRLVEMLYSCLPINKYPSVDLDWMWKKLLLNQFHDIIPGSSINEVYKVTHAEYRECNEKCDTLIDKSINGILVKDKNSIVLFNSLSSTFEGVVELPESVNASSFANEQNEELSSQVDNGQALVNVLIPPNSFITLHNTDKKTAACKKSKTLVMENSLIKYEFDKDGTIKSIYDKELGRELISKGEKANLLSVYCDQPNAYDAWDIDFFYEKQFIENAKCESISELSDGPLRQTMTLNFTISNSSIKQKVVLEKNKKRLDFITTVNWTERHRMLRTAFNMNLNTTKASFDIQYGYVERNTHRNTSWDWAKFEVIAHKYADISEPDYGIALLNDCKYGYKVLDSSIDLCLLRSPTHPDPDADRGTHEFTYSLLPHEHSHVESNVIEEASFLNRKPFAVPGYKCGIAALPCKIFSDGISIEVLKKAEKEDCLVIRLVETKGKNSEGELVFDKPGHKLIETDIMEWKDGREIKCKNSHTLKLKPFEIATFKIK